MDIAFVGIVVNLRFRRSERLVDARNSRQHFILDLDGQRRGIGNIFGYCRNCRHRVADETHGIDGERVLVFRNRQDAERTGHFFANQSSDNARHRERSRKVDVLDACVRHRAAHELHVGHARKFNIICKAGLATNLCATVDTSKRLADDLQLFGGLLDLLWHM